jgi:predicted small secreted protein
MMQMNRNRGVAIRALAALALAGIALAGCNTVRGVGDDLKSAADTVDRKM